MTPKNQIDLIAGVMGWQEGCNYEGEPDDSWHNGKGVFMADINGLTPAGAEAVRDRLVEDGCVLRMNWFDADESSLTVMLMVEQKDNADWWGVTHTIYSPDERTATREAAAQVWRDK